MLLSCIAVFLIATPLLVAYSMGYRFDFETNKIVATGGIYIRTFPTADGIAVDSGALEKPGLFSNSVFVQNLMPKQHFVLIKKDGYFDYQKTLLVKENEVTKIENVNLFKTSLKFDQVSESANSFSISPDGKNILVEATNTKSLDFYYYQASSLKDPKEYSFPAPYATILDFIWAQDSSKVLLKVQNSSKAIVYYLLDFSAKTQQTTPLSYFASTTISDISFNPQDSRQFFYINNKTLNLLKDKKITPLLKDVTSYKINGDKIIWLSTTGALSQSDFLAKTTQTLLEGLQNYKIEIISGRIMLSGPDFVYEYLQQEKTLKSLGQIPSGFKLLQSPNGKNVIYYNNSEIYIYSFEPEIETEENGAKLFSANKGEQISKCFWLNDNYIIFQLGAKIIISEIDFRGNINSVEMPQNYPPSPDSRTPRFIFNQQDSKAYILTQNFLYSSEKLTP